ncbi:MAG: rhomboid family intramembrane serine protease [candidate division Zixibacteria bacterium]
MLFPIRDNNPTVNKPYVTVTLIIINALIFLYSQSLGMPGFNLFVYQFGFTPDFYFGAPVDMVMPAWYMATPFTSMFLHGGWMHLIGNMLFLWIYGNNIEDYLGPIKFLIFYLLAGVLAVALYSLPNLGSQIPLVGASGAIAGVMGAYVVLYPRAEITCLLFFFFIQFIVLPAKIVLGLWFVLQLFNVLAGSSSGIAYLAHIGGFLFGYLLFRLIIKIRGHGTTGSGGQRVFRMNW